MFLSSAPNSAAVVANPDLKLCPAYLDASKPAFSAYFFIIKATDLSDNLKSLPSFFFVNFSLT